MALVYLAFVAQAAVVPALADAAEGAAQRLQEPLAARIAHAVQAGELQAHLDAEHEAARLGCCSTGCASSSSHPPADLGQVGAGGPRVTTSPRSPASQPPPGTVTAPAPSGADGLPRLLPRPRRLAGATSTKRLPATGLLR